MYPFSGCHFGLFLVYFVVFFSFLKTVCFLMKFCAYIIDNILLFDRLKSCMRVFSFDWGYFVVFFWEGGGRGAEQGVLWFSSISYESFTNFCYYSDNHTQNSMAVVFALQGHFRVPFCPLYNPPCFEEPKMFSCSPQILSLLWCSLGKRIALVLPLLGTFWG